MDRILEVNTVHDYNGFVGQPDRHPFVSVIEYGKVSPIYHTKCRFSVYGLFLLDDTLEQLAYGSAGYDYQEGSLVCVSPGQLGGVDYDGTTFERRGWALLFSPELLYGTPLQKHIQDYNFLFYSVNEALHPTVEERQTIVQLLQQMECELERQADERQDAILLSYIELILNFCKRFHDRRFMTSQMTNSGLIARFEALVREYYASGKSRTEGLLTVQHCAGELCLSYNYFSDLVKKATGDTASSYIRRHIVGLVKDRLVAGEAFGTIAEDLGCDYPQHLSRMFKKTEGCTPTEYVQNLRK